MSTRLLKIVGIGLLLFVVTAAMEAVPFKATRPQEQAVLQGRGMITDLAFSPDGKVLAVANAFEQGVRLWDVAAAKVAVVLPHRDAYRVQFSPNGKTVATAGKHIKLWDVASGRELATFKYLYAHWMLFSGDGKKLDAIGKKTVTILNVEKKRSSPTIRIGLASWYPRIRR